MLTAMMMAHNILPGLAALFSIAAGVIFTVQVYRWWYKAVLKEPMLLDFVLPAICLQAWA